MLAIYYKSKNIDIMLSAVDFQRFLEGPLEKRCVTENFNRSKFTVNLDYGKKLANNEYNIKDNKISVKLTMGSYYRLLGQKALVLYLDGKTIDIYFKSFC
jgi:hypothetical protein